MDEAAPGAHSSECDSHEREARLFQRSTVMGDRELPACSAIRAAQHRPVPTCLFAMGIAPRRLAERRFAVVSG